MCGGFTVQQGIALDDGTLSKMTEEERGFWMDFLGEAKQVIDEKTARDETQPFAPPQSLREKYQKALIKYDGGKYCQVRQLQGVFVF
mgnify:CR=1 FL=1